MLSLVCVWGRAREGEDYEMRCAWDEPGWDTVDLHRRYSIIVITEAWWTRNQLGPKFEQMRILDHPLFDWGGMKGIQSVIYEKKGRSKNGWNTVVSSFKRC